MTVISPNPACCVNWCCCDTSFSVANFSVSGVQTEIDFTCTPSQGICGLVNDNYSVELPANPEYPCSLANTINHKCITFTCPINSEESYKFYVLYQAYALLTAECVGGFVTLESFVGINVFYLDGSFGCPEGADLCVLYLNGDLCVHGSPAVMAEWKREVTIPLDDNSDAACKSNINGIHTLVGVFEGPCAIDREHVNMPEEMNVTYA